MSTKNTQLAPLDPLRRYEVETALEYLGISRRLFYQHIKAGHIATIAEGTRKLRDGRIGAGRRLVPGSEIVRLSAAPMAAHP